MIQQPDALFLILFLILLMYSSPMLFFDIADIQRPDALFLILMINSGPLPFFDLPDDMDPEYLTGGDSDFPAAGYSVQRRVVEGLEDREVHVLVVVDIAVTAGADPAGAEAQDRGAAA